MKKRLQGKSAIVTGAARGIGLGITRILAQNGAKVLLLDRTRDGVERAERARLDEGFNVVHAVADISSANEMKTVVQNAMERFGRIDILCPNAAIFDSSSIVDMPESLWDKMLSINLKGVFLTVQSCLPAMLEQHYGRIVVTSSITGNRTAIAGMAHYAASKGGINGFIRAAALELAREGITINGVEPGHVWTEGAAPDYDPEFKRAVENFIPMGRFGEPEDVGKTVLFLASDDAAYITGQTFIVDGGVTLPEYPPRHAHKESR